MKFLFVLAGLAGLGQLVDDGIQRIPVAPYAPPQTLAEAASFPTVGKTLFNIGKILGDDYVAILA